MERKEVLDIVKSFLKTENIVAMHGTTVDAAKSIMNTGLRVKRTTFLEADEQSDAREVATYTWKNVPTDNSSNVIIVIPSIFIQITSQRSPEEVKMLIEQLRTDNLTEGIIKNVSWEMESDYSFLPSEQNYIIPQEFIRGAFIHTNNTGGIAQAELFAKLGREAALDYSVDNLEFMENPRYFENLTVLEQRDFVYKHLKSKGFEDDYIAQLLDEQLPIVNRNGHESGRNDAIQASKGEIGIGLKEINQTISEIRTDLTVSQQKQTEFNKDEI